MASLPRMNYLLRMIHPPPSPSKAAACHTSNNTTGCRHISIPNCFDHNAVSGPLDSIECIVSKRTPDESGFPHRTAKSPSGHLSFYSLQIPVVGIDPQSFVNNLESFVRRMDTRVLLSALDTSSRSCSFIPANDIRRSKSTRCVCRRTIPRFFQVINRSPGSRAPFKSNSTNGK